MYNLGMIYKYNQLVQKYGSRRKADSYIQSKKYIKISRGIYTDKNTLLSEKEEIFSKYEFATLTMQSAFEYYDLSDYIPEFYHLVTPISSARIKNEKVKQLYMKKSMLEVGRTKVNTKYGYFYIFDIERMLIELFRLKSQLDKSYFLEIVKSYRKKAENNEIDFKKIDDYCSKITYGKSIKKHIQEVIL